MKKLTKVLTAVLLVAVAVTAFAIFGTLAAEEPTYGTTLYDMDSLTALANQKNWNGIIDVKYDDVDGQRIWTFSHDMTTQADPGDKFMSAGGLGSETMRIRDVSDEKKKNVDYFVIDLDIATDSELFDSLNLNSYLYSAAGKRIGTGNAGRNPQFKRDANGRPYVNISKSDQSVYHPDDKGNKWVNITLVYDFHTKDDGSITNACYVYFDGIYAGQVDAFNAGTAYINNPRIEAAFSTFNQQSVSLANFTFTSFEAGYAGPLTQGALANADVNLADLADLKYTQENCPENPEGYDARPVIATIAHTADGVTTETEVRDAKDLKHLVEGDVVTVRRSFSAPEIYGIVTRGNVTWLDYKGVNIKAPAEGQTPAVTIPKIYVAKADSDWVIINGGSIYSEGNAAGSLAAGDDLFHSGLHSSRECWIVLLNDVVSHGANAGRKTPRYGFHYDLNGYTLTLMNDFSYIEAQDASDVTVDFKNGTLNFGRPDDPSTPDVNEAFTPSNVTLMTTTTDKIETFIFENLTINIYGNGTFIDQRCGRVIYRNCTINTNSELTSLKSHNGKEASLTVENCSVNIAGNNITSIRNAATGGYRLGSYNCAINLVNSTFKTAKTLIDVTAYAHETKTPTEIEALNDNVARITIDGCDIETIGKTSDLLNVSITKYAEDGSMSLDVDLDITGSTIKANNLVLNEIDVTDVNIAEANISVNVGAGNKLMLLNADGTPASVYAENASDEAVVTSLSLANGALMNTNTIGALDSVSFESEAAEIVCTSVNGAYGYIITDEYDAHPYKLGENTTGEFFWNRGEGETPDPAKAVATAKTALYEYAWAKVDGVYTANIVSKLAFSAKSNLTLCDYIYFNLFINKAQYDAAIAAGVAISGAVLNENTEVANIDGVDYYKFQIKDIALECADDAVMTVGISFAGAYGDSYSSTKTFSVLSYAESILNKSTDEKSVALIESLLNYIVAACNYASVDASAVAEKAAALIDGKEFGAIAGEAEYEALEGVEVAIRYGNVLYLGVKANAGDVITVSYTSLDGTAVSITKTADENGEIYVAIKAYDFASDLTITRGADSATMNIQGYYNALAGDAAAQAMVEAIYNYATAAAAYKATMAN